MLPATAQFLVQLMYHVPTLMLFSIVYKKIIQHSFFDYVSLFLEKATIGHDVSMQEAFGHIGSVTLSYDGAH